DAPLTGCHLAYHLSDYCGTPCDSSNRASRRCPSPIQTPVLNGLAHVAGRQLIGAGEVSDRASDLEHPVVCPCREAQARNGLAEQPLDWLRQRTVAPQVTGSHVRVGMQPGPVVEPLTLADPGQLHPLPDDRAGLLGAGAGEIPV